MKEFTQLPFRAENRPAWYGPLGYAAAPVSVTLATAVLWVSRPALGLGSVYLVYLVAVVAVAVGWGWKQGFLASVLAFLAANFFFIQPIFTFTIADPQDVLALVIFLGIAALTSQLVARLRQEAREARRGQQVAATLYGLSQTISRQHNLKSILDEVCTQLGSVLQLEACTITIRDPARSFALTSYRGTQLKEHEVDAHTLRSRLNGGQHSVGVMILRFPENRQVTRSEEQLVAAFGEQLEVAVERDRLQQVAIETEVLRRTDALRAALLSAVGHDLRTPLGSIKAAATSLLEPPAEWSEEDQKAFLRTIVSEVDRINRLATNLLDMSRIEAGQLHPHKELHRIEDVLNTVLDTLAAVLVDHPVDIDIEPNLPSVPMDVVEIDEVLTNLLENAKKYTPPGTPVHIRLRREKDDIEVEIADEGPGIPPAEIPHLFSRFYRVTAGAAGAGGAKGTGLGLAIVKGIVEAHGGRVRAGGRPGGGALFTFTLPLQGTEHTPQQGKNEEPQSGPRMSQTSAQVQPAAAAVPGRAATEESSRDDA